MKKTIASVTMLALALLLASVFACTRFNAGGGQKKNARAPRATPKDKEALKPKPEAVRTAPEAATFTLDKDSIAVGEYPMVTFSSPLSPRTNERYWITVVAADAPDEEWGQWQYLDAGAESAELKSPAQPGPYEVRLHDGYPARQYHVVCRRSLAVEAPAELAEPAVTEEPAGRMVKEVQSRWGNGEPMTVYYYRTRGDGRDLVKSEVYNEDGQILEQTHFQDNMKNGAYTQWFENGEVSLEAKYINGRKQGRYVRYREDGTVRCEGNLKDGRGDLEFLDEYGNLDHVESFEDYD